MTYYKEYLDKKGSSDFYASTLALTNNTVMVRCNLGWDGDGDGWYIYGLFDTGNMAVLDGYSGVNNEPLAKLGQFCRGSGSFSAFSLQNCIF